MGGIVDLYTFERTVIQILEESLHYQPLVTVLYNLGRDNTMNVWVDMGYNSIIYNKLFLGIGKFTTLTQLNILEKRFRKLCMFLSELIEVTLEQKECGYVTLNYMYSYVDSVNSFNTQFDSHDINELTEKLW